MKTSDCQESTINDKLSVQEQLNIDQKMSARKQMPFEGLPQVVPNDQNLKWGYRVYKTFFISLVFKKMSCILIITCGQNI